MITRPEVTKIAMANPATAPYGTVARMACAQLDGWPELEKKLVYGANVAQAFQYAQAGVARVAFVALSLALSDKGASGCFWEIEESARVQQKACVTGYTPVAEAAGRFLRYATSSETASLREKLGYR